MQKRGVIVLDRTAVRDPEGEPRARHPQASRAMSFSAGVGAAAVQMVREYAAIVDARNQGRLAERTRVAQDLHDTLLQGFFAVSMQLRVAVEGLPAGSAARQRFGTVMQLLKRVLDEGRCTVQGLRSHDERGESLGQALARVPHDLGFSSEVAFRVVVHGKERKMRAESRDDIYRIVCEAIVNAHRHSGAKNIRTEIEYGSAELRLAVRDNGCGIDSQTLQRGRDGHWGLQGMRERADRIGGRLRVFSRTGHGTKVEMRVPGEIVYEPSSTHGA